MTNLNSIKENLKGYTARDFFSYARAKYLGQEIKPNDTLESILRKTSEETGISPEKLWASQEFQLLFRATTPEDLAILGINGNYKEEAQEAIRAGRMMSLLPYNTLMSDETIKKFIPSRPEKFSGAWEHSMDPYGIFRKMDKVVAIDKEGNETYLATRKFPYAVLANITEACHIGCDGCYKGSMVRTALSALAHINPEYAKIKKQLSLQEKRAEEQARLLVKWLNNNPEVDTIVMSGGEPTLFSNEGLEEILNQYKRAEHIKVVRMCTSAPFQGMWYRIDDGFVNALADFEKETGKQFYINAHVTDENQLSAPEARIAVDKLQRKGISVHLQMPIQEGINFRRDNLSWSSKKIGNVSKQAYKLGVIPYKAIIDMHSPSHPDLTVPLETFTKVIGVLDQHETHSDHERWQAYNILHEQGNLYLTAYPHFTATKEVDEEKQRVTYFIPKLDFNERKRIVVHTYEEPLILGHNDNLNSFGEIQDRDIRDRIAQVRESYRRVNNDPEELRGFYEISGIWYPTNKPLIM